MQRLIVSDIPTPWREPVFERVYQAFDGGVRVVYFKNNERRRLWTFKMGSHPRTIPRCLTFNTQGAERFLNPGLVPLLLKDRPRYALLSTCMKDPSGWLAMGMCRMLGTKVSLLDDAWLGRDFGVEGLRRWARWHVYNRFGDAYVGTSRQTLAMFRHYNPRIREEQCFLSHLVADNGYFRERLASRSIARDYDVLFSGRIVAVKNPVFFAEVCAGVRARCGRCRVLIIGDGDQDLKARMQRVLQQHKVDFEFAGFIPHAELPDYYARARVLLLPTSGDCWGVVINEAMLAGTPVVTTELTAAAGELVLHEVNGYVLPLEREKWITAVVGLLDNDDRWRAFSERARDTVADFNYERAAAGIVDSFRYLERAT